MNRRQVLRALSILAAGPSTLSIAPTASAQTRAMVPRVGFLAARSFFGSIQADPASGPFLSRMRELGYVEAKTVAYEWRSAEGAYERLPKLAADLVAAKVNVLVAATPPAVRAAIGATKSIPIVMVAVGDPVTLGFVASLRRPGGNVTGVTNAIDDVSRKYLEFLRLAMPGLKRVASLANPENPNYRIIYEQVAASGKAMGIDVPLLEARTPEQIDLAFADMRRSRTGAVILQGDGFFSSQSRRIGDLAKQNQVLSIGWTRSLVESGVLMSYGQNVDEDFTNAANFVDRILKGAQPRDLPVEQPTNPKLTINRRTAAALGIKLPADLMIRAAEVIE